MHTKLPDSIYSFLAGAWILVNTTTVTPNGTFLETAPAGVEPIGIINYAPNGYMSANLMATEPARRPSGLVYPAHENDTDYDWALIGKHTMTYAGPYSVDKWSKDGMSGTVTHGGTVLSGSDGLTFAGPPGWVGDRQERNFTLFKAAWNGKGMFKGTKGGKYGKWDGRGADLLRITGERGGWPETGFLVTLWWRRGPKTF